jgi:hypothetical protein
MVEAHPRGHIKTAALLAVINVLLLGAVAYAAAALVISARDLRFDFYPHYVGGRAVWSGQNPYTPEVTTTIQRGMFGDTLPPEADQQNMAYPAYASVLLGPVLWLSAHTAIALWMAIQFCAVLWTPVIWLDVLRWRPAPWLAGALLLGLLFAFRYPMDLFVLAQFSGTVLLALTLGFWLLRRERDVLAGAVLCLATVPPTIGGPLAGALLLAYALRGRWRGLLAFAAGMIALNAASLLLIGNWLPAYLEIVSAYSEYAPLAWAMGLLPAPLRVVFMAGLLALSAWMLGRFLRAESPAASDTDMDLVITALIVSLLLLPQTGYYYFVLLIPPLLAIFCRAGTLPVFPRRLLWGLGALALLSPWLYVQVGALTDWQTLLVPLQVLALWCAVNAPRWMIYG